jgi:hypothetical protein
MCTFAAWIPVITAAIGAAGTAYAANEQSDATKKAASVNATATREASAANAAALASAQQNTTADAVNNATTGTVAAPPVRADSADLTIASARKASTAARLGTRGLRSDLTISGLSFSGPSASGLNF